MGYCILRCAKNNKRSQALCINANICRTKSLKFKGTKKIPIDLDKKQFFSDKKPNVEMR